MQYLVALALLVPYAASANWLDTAATQSLAVIEQLVLVFAALALIVFLWGMVQFISHADSKERRVLGRQQMLWGIVGLFVVVSVWGFVQLMQGMFDVSPTKTLKRVHL